MPVIWHVNFPEIWHLEVVSFAIDKSPDSVETSKARVLNEALPDTVTVQVGDATDLEFPS